MSDEDIQKLLTRFKNFSEEQKIKILSDLLPLHIYASISVVECDFSSSIELGLSILSKEIDCLNSNGLRDFCQIVCIEW